MSSSKKYISLNGSCIPEKVAMIPAITSGLYYGAGCFETLVAEENGIFKFDEHIQRLNRGLEYLGVSNEKMIKAESILREIKTLLVNNSLVDKRSRIRIQVSLEEKGGYSISKNASIIVVITADSTEKNPTPRNLILSETSVVPSSAVPGDLKLSNMLHYRQAFREAEGKGADDAIMITEKGFVAETSIANIFWMKDDTIYTPSEECEILPGIMRNSLIEIVKDDLKYELNEGKFTMDELLKADLVWLTNSVLEFVPVAQIENISFKYDEQFLSVLQNKLNRYKKENTTHV